MNMNEYKEYMRKVKEGVIETGTNACNYVKEHYDAFKKDMDKRMAEDELDLESLFGKYMLPTDVVETDDSMIYIMDVPGCEKKDISVQIEDKELVISVNRVVNYDSGDCTSHEREDLVLTRRFKLPNKSEKSAKADYENGVLTVVIPRQKSKTINIEIN